VPTPIVIGSSFVAQYPEGGGNFWVPLQYLLGFRDLGHDAWWLEYLWSRGDRARDRVCIDTFLRHAAASELDRRGLGLRLRFLSGGMSPASRLVNGKVLPERSGYYVGLRMVEGHVAERGIAATVRAAAEEIQAAEDRASGIQTA
jgi:hypothetical protein